jgi:hypothetical protein
MKLMTWPAIAYLENKQMKQLAAMLKIVELC